MENRVSSIFGLPAFPPLCSLFFSWGSLLVTQALGAKYGAPRYLCKQHVGFMTHSAPMEAGGDAELLALRDALRTPTTTPSLAKTFPHPGKRHWARESPLPVRLARATRRLANNGAMAPEGCAAGEMERVRTNHRVRIDVLKEIMGTLWSFRLLGWLPSDTLYLTWSQVEEFVAAGTRRPTDTRDLLPDWFTRRHSVDELKTFRDGKDA